MPKSACSITATWRRSSGAIAAARGLTRADEIFSPALAVNYGKQLGIFSFGLQGTGGYDFYASNTILNRERIGVQGGATTQLSGCQLTARSSYMRRQSDLADLNVITTKNTEEDVVAGLGRGLQRLRTSGSLGFRPGNLVQQQRTPSVLPPITKAFRHRAVLLYGAGSLGDISLTGQYVDTQFQNRLIPLFAGSQEDGYKVYSGGVHYEKDLDAAFRVALSLSETSLSYDGLSLNFSGLTYDATLIYHPDSRFQVQAHFRPPDKPVQLSECRLFGGPDPPGQMPATG